MAAALAAVSLAAAPAQAGDAPRPYDVSWSKGTCLDCQTARMVSDVPFARDASMLALGFNPPGQTGTGDWSILHTLDGGRTWRELPRTYEHNDPPSISFANPRDGWIMVVDMANAEQRLLVTRDGGAHWRRLPLRDLFVRGVQYVGHGVGYAHAFNPYAKTSYLYATTDDGHGWRKTLLPKGLDVGAMAFSGALTGVLAGCLGGRVVTLHTADGGRHWTTTTLDTPSSPQGPNGSCGLDVDGLNLSADGRGSLLTQKRFFAIGDSLGVVSTWTTTDGGRSWKRAFESRFTAPPNAFIGFDGPYWLGSKVMLLFRNGPGDRSAVLYSADGGARWSETPIGGQVSGCATDHERLRCAGDSGTGFSVATFTASVSR